MAATISSPTIRCTFMPPAAAIAPATNNRESPGRNGVTTSPVSQKMIRKSTA
jgi:hypothetical protein